MAYHYQPYPKMLFKDGAQLIVDGYAQQLAAVADGWGLTPDWTPAMRNVVPLPHPDAPRAITPESSVLVPLPLVVASEAEQTVATFFRRGRGRPRKT